MKYIHRFVLLLTFSFVHFSLCSADTNLLQNSGFEGGLKHWHAPAAHTQHLAGLGRDHSAALQVNSSQIDYKHHASVQIDGVLPNAVYQFSVWAKTAHDSPSVKAAIKIEYYNKAGQNTAGRNQEIQLNQGEDWKQISLNLPSKNDTAFARLYLRVFGKGSVVFDDASFQLFEGPPPVSIMSPNPALIQSEKEQNITFKLHLGNEIPEKDIPSLKAILHPLDRFGKTVESTPQILNSQIQQRKENEVDLDVAIPALTEGSYAFYLSYTLNKKNFKTEKPVYIYTQKPNRKPENLTENGTILHEGKPFFPIGIYHPVKYSSRGKTDFLDIQSKALELVAKHGFNAIQGDHTLDLTHFESSLEIAKQHGLVVDVPFYAGMRVAENLENSLEKIQKFGQHPAILNWKLIDEPDMHPQVTSQVPASYYAVKNSDKTIPVELTLNRDNGISTWRYFSDIVQILRYPVPSQPLTDVSDFTRFTKAQLQPWQNLSFVVQCGWTPDMKTQPTVDQARSMVYLALIEGAKGIWWYSMYDPNWDLTKTPLWPYMKDINAEIKAVSDPVMLGEHITELEGNNPKVLFRALGHEGKLYILVTNPEDESQNVTLSLPNTLKIENGKTLSGEFLPTVSNQEIQLSLKAIDSQTLVFDLD